VGAIMVMFPSVNCSLRRLSEAITPRAGCRRQSLCAMISDGKSDPKTDRGGSAVQ
jgi:hypothetical protein